MTRMNSKQIEAAQRPTTTKEQTTIWVVLRARPASELEDICFETDLAGFALQVRGGLTQEELKDAAMFTNKNAAVDEAFRRIFAARDAAVDEANGGWWTTARDKHGRDVRVFVPGKDAK